MLLLIFSFRLLLLLLFRYVYICVLFWGEVRGKLRGGVIYMYMYVYRVLYIRYLSPDTLTTSKSNQRKKKERTKR